jgi:class 3 adenylate cyclase/tetratricopeptide (TPR) repeat protein
MNPTATPDVSQAVIEAYLPRTLIEHWTASPHSARIWSAELDGCLMLCDMSGFTAMSERLARLGKEGAELMAGILNGFFSRMLGIADQWGGFQMKFGGDAMLLYFGGEGAARRGARCALEMQHVMPEFASVPAGGENHQLRMRIGMHAGTFFAASLGEEHGVLHYLLTGPDVNATAAVEGRAQPGEVVASPACAEALTASGAELISLDDGYVRVIAVQAAPPAAGAVPGEPPRDVLLQYILPPLAARLAAGDTRPGVAEHRRVTAVFINLLGIAELLQRSGRDHAFAEVDRYVKIVLRNLEKHSGYLAASDAAEVGDKLIILFGAPVSSERDELNALRFAIDLQSDLKAARLPLRHRVGMTTGSVFAGEIGSPSRREYTVIGDTVNLAARLMASAKPGEIYVGSTTAERAQDEFDLRPLRPLRVKGKSGVIRAFRLTGAKASAAASPSLTSEVLGREREIARLLDLSRQAADEGGAWAFVSGEPGIGKSTLIASVAATLESDGWRHIATRCQAQQSGVVLGAWADVLARLLDLDPRAGPEGNATKLRDAVRALQPARVTFIPLLADLLSLPAEPEPMLEFLDARRKRALLNALVIGVVRAAARTAPLVLSFDDLHQADVPSRELLAEFLEGASGGCLVLATARGVAVPTELAAVKPDEWLSLAEVDADSARRIATRAGASNDAIAAIIERAQGNPMFIEELALNTDLASTELPLTINEVILARLDRLPHDEKAVLKVAAVAGATFGAAHLQVLLKPEMGAERVSNALSRLAANNFVRVAPEAMATHAFSHILTQEVVYETLLFARRRELHNALGSHIEREQEHDLPAVAGTLLHHFDRAGVVPKTVTYAVMTGERAARVFANRQAIDYYTQALDALSRMEGEHPADRSALLERIGDGLEMEGRHRAATEAFSDALAAWRTSPPEPSSLVPRDRSLDRLREAALCRRLGVSYERRSEYDASLEWLDNAQQLLPARSSPVGSEIWASRSMALFRKGMYADAIVAGRKALTLARRARDPRRIAYAQNMLANSYLEEGRLRPAIRQLTQAIATYEAIGDVYGTAAANNNIGNCYQALGNLDAAILHYEVSLEANMRAGNDAAIVHNNIGETLLMRGSTREAAIHLQEVIRAHETDAELNAVAGLSHVNLSRCMVALGDLAAADDHLARGTLLLTDVGAEGLLAEARLQAAALQLIRGDAEGARRVAIAVLESAYASDAKMLIVSAERIVGTACAQQGNDEQAIAHLVAGAALARKIGAHQDEARLLIALASVRKNDRRQMQKVAAHLRRALQLLAHGGAPDELVTAAEQLQEDLFGGPQLRPDIRASTHDA